MAEQANRDQNFVTSVLFTGSDGGTYNLEGDEATGRIYVDIAGGGGTVTSVSVVTANGFAGTVATATTTPAITLTTTINSPVLAGNGTAISAATTTGSGSTVVLNNSPVFVDDITVGVAASATGSILFKGTTSGTVTLSVADAAGTWTLKLPTTDGDASQFLQTDGSGNTTWATPGGGGTIAGTIADTQVAFGTAADTIGGEAGFTYISGTNTLNVENIITTGDITVGDDLLLTSSGAIINFNAGDMTITHSANLLTVAGGSFAVTGAITGTTSLTLGVAAGTTGSVVLTGTTSGAVTLSVADAAGTWTMKLPTTDGNNLEFLQTDGSGNTSWVAGTTVAATSITVADEATDTSCFPVFVTAATGSLGPKTNTGLTFNSNTSLLTATLVAGTTSVTSATIRASSNDSGSLGASGTAFSDLFLASGAVIDFAAGNSVITHSSAVLTVSTGDLRVTTAGTNSASAVTVGGTQTLTSKTLTSPAITTATFSGTQVLAENASIALDPAGSADGKYTGITIAGTAGATLAFGDLCYLKAADSQWYLTDADAAATADVMIGMCVLAANDNDPTVLLLMGQIRADAKFPAMTIGNPMYMGDDTAGTIETAIPAGADNVIRRVGYALTADELYFNPSMDSQITVA